MIFLSLKLRECFSYKVSLGDRYRSDQTLRTGGVYTLFLVEKDGEIVSKDSLFFYNSIIKSFDHLFSVRVPNTWSVNKVMRLPVYRTIWQYCRLALHTKCR